jgi:6-pyruvoyltetrahydropterin/6-carboxytetrahydropterin synthase
MYEVSVDETFAAAHNLRGYKGKCEDLHGHNYKVRVTLAGKEVDSVGLLYDFVHLKQVIQSVIRSLDHKYLNELPPFDELNPSAENIARHIYEQTAKQLRDTSNGAGVASITVWETETTAATYRP